MDILILGGTGFLGRHLVEAALGRGHRVTLFNRGIKARICSPRWRRSRAIGRQISRPSRDGAGTRRSTPAATRPASSGRPQGRWPTRWTTTPSSPASPFTLMLSCRGQRRRPGTGAPGPDGRGGHGGDVRGLKALCERAVEEEMPGRVFNVRPGLISGPYDPTDRFTFWPRRIAAGGEVLAPTGRSVVCSSSTCGTSRPGS